MKFWDVSHKYFGEFGSYILWRFGVVRGVAKMFEHIFWEHDGYGEQKTKMKNTKKCNVRLINGFGVKSSRS